MAEQKIILLRGLPGSGKSTWAKAWRNEDPKNRAVVNRDSIRWELFGQYEDLSDWQEMRVSKLQQRLADLSLREGMSLCVDDTNVAVKHHAPWRKMARTFKVPFEIIDISTPLEECLRRNRLRGEQGGRFVPEYAIMRMHSVLAEGK